MGAIGTAIGKGMKDEQYRCWVTQGGWLVVAGGRQGESAEVKPGERAAQCPSALAEGVLVAPGRGDARGRREAAIGGPERR